MLILSIINSQNYNKEKHFNCSSAQNAKEKIWFLLNLQIQLNLYFFTSSILS